MTTTPAVPAGTLRTSLGKIIPMDPGPCLWCHQYVAPQRDEAGATNPFDPCWATEDGDFGCDRSPETNDEGVGSHARPYDLALLLLSTPERSPTMTIDWKLVSERLRCPICGERAHITPGTDGTSGEHTHRFPISRELAEELSSPTPEDIAAKINHSFDILYRLTNDAAIRTKLVTARASMLRAIQVNEGAP